jgi:hypothetical protein
MTKSQGPDVAEQRSWIGRVLGVALPDRPVSRDDTQTRANFSLARQAEALHPGRSGEVLAVWQAAKEAADGQLRLLSDRLRTTGIPALAEVSQDVETLLDQVRVGLVAALLNYDKDPAKPETRAAALSAIEEASDWLSTDERVRAVDQNPFGVLVTVGATLGAALQELQRDLAGKAGASG